MKQEIKNEFIKQMEKEIEELIFGTTLTTQSSAKPIFKLEEQRKESIMPPKNFGYEIGDIFITPFKTRETKTEPIDKFVKRVIYNNPATIVYWEDGTKTVVKAMEGDTFDPERGFLQAYFEKFSGLNRTKGNKFIKTIVKENYADKLDK